MSDKPTREQILAEPAGRALDCLVSRYVFGHQNVRLEPEHVWGALRDPTPEETAYFASNGVSHAYLGVGEYSTWMHYTWRVVEEMEKRLEHFEVPIRLWLEDEWHCEFGVTRGCSDDPSDTAYYYAHGETAPLAICRSALIALLR